MSSVPHPPKLTKTEKTNPKPQTKPRSTTPEWGHDEKLSQPSNQKEKKSENLHGKHTWAVFNKEHL